VVGGRKVFDRLADRVEKLVSHAAFFGGCVLLIVLWAPLIIWLDVNTWQLIVNTATTIITFLLLALLTNTQRRAELRTERALRAIEGRIVAVQTRLEEVRRADDAEAPGREGA
jgi:low affinity Fe/Cu permease